MMTIILYPDYDEHCHYNIESSIRPPDIRPDRLLKLAIFGPSLSRDKYCAEYYGGGGYGRWGKKYK